MITTQRLQEITVALTLGKPLTAASNEEDATIEKVRADIAAIKAEGKEVAVLREWEV